MGHRALSGQLGLPAAQTVPQNQFRVVARHRRPEEEPHAIAAYPLASSRRPTASGGVLLSQPSACPVRLVSSKGILESRHGSRDGGGGASGLAGALGGGLPGEGRPLHHQDRRSPCMSNPLRSCSSPLDFRFWLIRIITRDQAKLCLGGWR